MLISLAIFANKTSERSSFLQITSKQYIIKRTASNARSKFDVKAETNIAELLSFGEKCETRDLNKI